MGMISGNRDIDRPLGRDDRPKKPKRSGIFTTERIALSLAAIAIFGVSTAVALRDRPFRSPAAIAITEPVEQTVAETTTPERLCCNVLNTVFVARRASDLSED
ncbi:hypothetical protein ABWH97_03425 [Nitratireductor sp. ac15]